MFIHIRRITKITKEDIPKQIEVFDDVLVKIFGAGASIIEKHILKVLWSKLGITPPQKEPFNFIECLKEVKRIYLLSPIHPSHRGN
jgi:hypothetical protein